jgi:uncharacterized protein (DUF736 family)
LALWAATLARKPRPSVFFPAALRLLAALTLQKALGLGPTLRCGPSGSAQVLAPKPVRHRRDGPGERTRRIPMPAIAIGHVTQQPDGAFKGQLKTLNIRADIEIVPNASRRNDSQPHFRVFARGCEIGAGWKRVGETSGREYVSLSLAAPEFGPRTLYANLGRAAGQDDDDAFALIWNPVD